MCGFSPSQTRWSEGRENVMGAQFVGKVRELNIVYDEAESAYVNIVFDLDEPDSNIVFLIPEDVFVKLDSVVKLFKERKAKDIKSKIKVLEDKAEQLKAKAYSLDQQVSDLEVDNG
jgi:hypothetical protein